MMNKKIKAWYFATEDRKLRYRDNRPIIIGETHAVDGEPELCEIGLHASERLIDALKHAPGPILYRVELSGKMDIGDDKISAQKRKYVWGVDATEVLREFARKQALINIDKIKKYVTKHDYDLIVSYLHTGDEGIARSTLSALRSAWTAVRSAESASWSVVASAAEAARSARSAEAARSALSAAEAEWAAVRSAEAAVWSAEAAVRSTLSVSRTAWTAVRSAAESASWSVVASAAEAARLAALSAANDMLTEMILARKK